MSVPARRRRNMSRSLEEDQDELQQEEQRHRSKRQRTQEDQPADSPYSNQGTISPSSSHQPSLDDIQQPGGAATGTGAGAGRISHACRPCNRQKLKCDGRHPCSRCLITVRSNSNAAPSSSSAVYIGQETSDEVRYKTMALEVCVYQPSMRGRTKRRKKKGSALGASSTMIDYDNGENGQPGAESLDGIYRASSIPFRTAPHNPLSSSRSTRASLPSTTATTRSSKQHQPPEQRETRASGVPTLQAAFYRSATLSQLSKRTPARAASNDDPEEGFYQRQQQQQQQRHLRIEQPVSPAAAQLEDTRYSSTGRTVNHPPRNDNDDLFPDHTTRGIGNLPGRAVSPSFQQDTMVDEDRYHRHHDHRRARPHTPDHLFASTSNTRTSSVSAPINSIQQHQHQHQLPPLPDRAKLTPFPMPGDEMNPLGVLAEASASLELERDREREREREGEKELELVRESERTGEGSGEQRMAPMTAEDGADATALRLEAVIPERAVDGQEPISGGLRQSRDDSSHGTQGAKDVPVSIGGESIPDSRSPRPGSPQHAQSSTSAAQPAEKTTTTDDIDGYYARPKQSTAGRRTLEGEAPHIMRLLTADDAHRLFDVYWQWFHPHLPVLDKERSEPVDVASRSNYLFNAICCCAARSFVPDLWNRLKEFAKMEMTRLPLEKTLDVVQAHLLYSEWNLIPAKRFEQDLTYLRAGLAIRTAIDINLHRVALFPDARSALPPWLLRSMIRTWLLTTVTDRTLSAQLGKPSSMRGENSVQRYLALLYGYIEVSKRAGDHQAVLDDSAVALWAEWTQILSRALDAFRNRAMSDRPLLESNIDCYPDLIIIHEKQFQEWADRAETLINSVDAPSVKKEVRIGRIRLYHFYAELIIASFGLNQALERESKALPFAFVHFQTIAIRLIECFEHDLQSKGLIKGCPDFVFTALTYAVVSLLKSTQARYSRLDGSPTDQVLLLCRRAADMLAKGAGASEHLPSIQATFLHRLLDIRSTSGRTTKSAAPPRPLNLQAFAQSFEHRNHETNWPPTAPSSGNVDAMAANTTFAPTTLAWSGQIGNSYIPAANEPQAVPEQRTETPLTFGAELPFDLDNYLAFSNTAQPSTSVDAGFPTYGQAIVVQNGNLDSFVQPTEHLPEIPVASLGLTMGNFMNDQGVMDMLFANQGLWKSILESYPRADG